MISFLSFGNNPIIYWILGYFLIGGIVYLSTQQKRRLSESYFLFISLSIFLMLRLPVILYPDALNTDENLLLHQTLELQKNISSLKIVSITSGNFLNSYLLILPTFLGVHFNYQLAHFVAFLLSVISLLFTYKTAQNFFGETTARLSFLVALFFLSLTQDSSFLHYSNELIAVLLLTAITYFYSQIVMVKPNVSLTKVFLLSFLIAILCFEKIQLLPIIAVLFIFTFGELFQHTKDSIYTKILQIVAAILTFLPFMLLFVTVNELYLFSVNIRNLSFLKEKLLLLYNFTDLVLFASTHLDFLWFCLPTFGIFVWFLLKNIFGSDNIDLKNILPKKERQFITIRKYKIFIFIAFLFLMTICAIAFTNMLQGHYWHFMILPITLLNAYFIKHSGLADYAPAELQIQWLKVSFFALTIIPFLSLFLFKIVTSQATNLYPTNKHIEKHLTQ